MITPCPHLDCENRTEFGYCKTTACINPIHSNIGTVQYGEGVQRNIVTNADRIRSMTDDELASYLALVEQKHNPDEDITMDIDVAYNEWRTWLKQEVKE